MMQIKEIPAALPLEDSSPALRRNLLQTTDTDPEMRPLPPSSRTGNWLARLVIVLTLVLAPVLAGQAMARQAGPVAVQSELTTGSEYPATGTVAPSCFNGALCAFVGSLAPRAASAVPVPGHKPMRPDAWVASSWIAAPGGHPPKHI